MEKARLRLCQVRFRETSASEPLMRCRKQVTMRPKLGAYTTPGGVQEKPVYCLGGVPHRSGVTLIQALVWNVGTFASRGCKRDGGSPSGIGMQVQGPNHLKLLW
jgi:hypothetical protein